MDLISRKAAIDRLNATPPGNWSKARYTRELWNVPSVHAVPLEKLCEWLAKNASWYAVENEGDSEEWKSLLIEWMEEQDESN